jgi:hydroxyacylglutathione hydrolase
MLKIIQIENNPVSSNCFFVFDKQYNNDCLLIDPESENERSIFSVIQDNQLNIEYILLTHEHFDHIWSVNAILNKFPKALLICNKEYGVNIVDRKRNCSLFYNQIGFELQKPSITTEELSNTLEWYDYKINFINTPGHSFGSICIKIDENLFTGDTLIPYEKTVTKLPGGSVTALKQTINYFHLLKGQNLLIHPGHGNNILLDKYDLNMML